MRSSGWLSMRRLIAVVTTAGLLAVSAGAAQASVPGAAEAPGVQAPAGLIQQLSVLQRAQVSTDVVVASQLPPVQRPRLIASLSRLVDTVAGTKIYLVVLRPLVGPMYLWKPDLGDVAELIAVTANSTWRTNLRTVPVPAVHLSDGNATGEAQSGRTLLGVQLVPEA
jgi:hypothetical protein